MSENIITQIRSQYEFFTRVEKRIADLILADPQKFVTYSTAKVAELCNVSQGSINNFAKKFTPEGFSFLKLELARCFSLQQDIQVDNLKKNVGKHLNIMERIIRQNISALCNTLEINDELSFKNAVDMIVSAENIAIFGIFQSGVVAKILQFNLIKLGKSANFVGDSLMFSVSASMLTEKDVAIAISSSGNTKEVIDAVEIAKKCGAHVISVTSNRFSQLAKLSDAVLLTTEGHGKSDGILERMRDSQFLVIDSICRYIELFNNGNTEKTKELNRIINSEQ